MAQAEWLLLLYELPTRQGSQRVILWRRLKKLGALPLKTSAYLLPDLPELHEKFQWLAKQIEDDGGSATLIRAQEIEGIAPRELAARFNAARAEDYGEVMRQLTELIRENRKTVSDAFVGSVDRFRKQLVEIQQIDFFNCPRAHDARMLLEKADGLRRKEKTVLSVLSPAAYESKIWLTRPQPHIDRVGSAWLIRKFIDPQARFVFGTETEHPEAIPYDIPRNLTMHGLPPICPA